MSFALCSAFRFKRSMGLLIGAGAIWMPSLTLAASTVGGPPPSAPTIIQPASQHDITVDGKFTDGVPSPLGSAAFEWGDVTPSAFIALPGSLTPTTVGTPGVNALLYAAIAQGNEASPELYLMYEYTGRTDATFGPGSFISDVQFPLTIGGVSVNATVEVRGASNNGSVLNSIAIVDPNTFVPTDVSVVVNGSVVPFDLDAALGFGPGELSSDPHFLLELGVPLNIPSGFSAEGDFFKPSDNDGYSPDPAFWGASAAKDVGDPPITSALFSINPDGSLNINPDAVPTPEPGSFVLLGLGLAGMSLAVRRRKARANAVGR